MGTGWIVPSLKGEASDHEGNFGEAADAAGGGFTVDSSGMDVSGMRRETRPRRERRDQFDEYGREFHGVSLWRGRLWPWAQAEGETGLNEAGIQQRNGCVIMTQHTENNMSRIDARIPLSVKDTIDRAAAMQGRTRTDFLIEAALEKAERVIAEQAVIRLAVQDQEMLANALIEEAVTEATPFLKDLAAEYTARVEEK
jgi:uncharacterized protein (DUF1778 family)